MNQQPLTALEERALGEALRGDAAWLEALRKQIPELRVTRREYNSAGGFTEFAPMEQVTRANIVLDAPGYPPIATVQHKDLPQGGDFIVWAKHGVIEALEAVAHGDGRWPASASSGEFTFVSS